MRRDILMRAIDDAIVPDRLEWGDETKMRDGTPKVDGNSLQSILGVTVMGPADDVVAVQVMGLVVTTPDSATAPLATIRAIVPNAEPWWRDTFEDAPTLEQRAFEGTTVAWARDMPWTDGARLSILLVGPTSLFPEPTPKPTPRVTPAPTPMPDLLAYLPTEINGTPITTARWTGATVPDDQTCLPVCRWQVGAYAKALGVDARTIEVVTATPVGNAGGPISLAAIRVPHGDILFHLPQWEAAIRATWPDTSLDVTDHGPGRWFEVFRQRRTAAEEIAPAWYVRDLGDVLVIVSDAVAQSSDYAPRRRITQILDGLPTPQ